MIGKMNEGKESVERERDTRKKDKKERQEKRKELEENGKKSKIIPLFGLCILLEKRINFLFSSPFLFISFSFFLFLFNEN